MAGIIAKRPAMLVSNHDCGIDAGLVPLRIPVRVGHTGYSPAGRSVPWSTAYNVPVPVTTDMNWLETYRMLAERVGADFPGPPSVDVPDPLLTWADDKLLSLGLEVGEKCAAVQIGVWQVQAWKEWPVSHLAEMCRSLWSQHKVRPVLMGDSGGAGAAAELQRLIPEVPTISLVGTTSVSEAAAIIERCDVTICNDSGLMHLSAAVGTPTVAVYGMTNPAKTWCYDSPHRFVRRMDTLSCYDLDTRVLESCPHRMCLTQLEPELVLSAVLDALDVS
jgi:heptosyltransferase-2